MKTCAGCEFMTEEDAGRGKKFFICTLGKYDWSKRPVFDYVHNSVKEPTAAIPGWCKRGLAEREEEGGER